MVVSAYILALGRRLLDALLYSSTWLALAAAALSAATFRLLGEPAPPAFLALVLAATLCLYNLDSVLPYKQAQAPGTSARKQWIRRHRRLLWALAVGTGLVTAALFLADARFQHLGFLGHLTAISVLYSLPVVRRRGRWWALRDVPLLKVLLIAYVWAAVTAALPALFLGQALAAAGLPALLGYRFLFVLALALVFDIRDYSKDLRAGTRTVPGVLGIRGARVVGTLALLGAGLLLPGASLPARVLPLLLAATVLWQARESRPDYFFALLTDGVLLTEWLVVYLIVPLP